MGILWVLGNILCYIFLIIRPLYIAMKSLSPFFKGFSGVSKSTSPDSILDCIEGNKEVPSFSKKYSYPEILFNGISPVLGVFFVYYFNSELKPFDLAHYPSLLAFSFIPFIAYWISRNKTHQFSIKNLAVIEAGLSFGIVLYLAYGIHFCSEMTPIGVFFLPMFGFALIAPVPATVYLLRQLIIVKSQITEQVNSTLSVPNNAKPPFNISPQTKGYLLFCLGVALLLCSLVFLGGQNWDSLIKAFTGGTNFMFSNLSF